MRFTFKVFIIIFMLNLLSAVVFGEEIENNYYEKAVVTDIIKTVEPSYEEIGELSKKIKMIVEIKSGKYNSKKIIMQHPIYKDTLKNIKVNEYDNVIMQIKEKDGLLTYKIVGKDRSGILLSLAVLFIGLVAVICKRDAIKILLIIAANVGLFFFGFMKLVYSGYPPMVMILVFVLASALVTIFLVGGNTLKSKVAFWSTVFSLVITDIMAVVYSKLAEITGYSMFDKNMIGGYFNKIKVDEIVTAGIIITALGIIIPISMNIAGAMEEHFMRSGRYIRGEYFIIGVSRGKRIVPKYLNIILFFYAGCFMLFMLIFNIFTVTKTGSMLVMVNEEFFIEEAVRIMIMGAGILISIPVTALMGEIIFARRIKK